MNRLPPPTLWQRLRLRLVALLTWCLGKLLEAELPPTPCPPAAPTHPRPHFQVDPQKPILQTRHPIHYKERLRQHEKQHGKPLKPVKRRKGSKRPKDKARCAHCEAPAKFLYLNDGKKQLRCKVCDNTSYPGVVPLQTVLLCPHCTKHLQRAKTRKKFIVYKCVNDRCPAYRKAKAKLSPQQRERYKTHPHEFKLRYLFREPTFDLEQLAPSSPNKPRVDLARVYQTANVVALCLYFYVDRGLSLRETAQTLQDLFAVAISHQTVANYLEAAAFRLAPLLQQHDLEPTGMFVVDEGYILLRGKWGYVFFSLDPQREAILAHHVSETRDTLAATTTLAASLAKLAPQLAQKPHFRPLLVTDGNPIYQLAVLFLAQHGQHLDHRQVIGLTNEDPQSAQYRPLKQAIERLMRTYKQRAARTHGFQAAQGAEVFTTLFVVWYNFLRPHQALGGKPPIELQELQGLQTATQKWCRLLERAQDLTTDQD